MRIFPFLSFEISFILLFSNIHVVAQRQWDISHTVIEPVIFHVFTFRACFINHLSKLFPNCFHLAKYFSFVYECILLY